MKLLIVSSVCLLAGAGVGAYVGYHWNDRRVTNEAVKLLVEGGESSEAEHAARAARAIELIETGQPQTAVQILSKPVAHYYCLYSDRADTDVRQRICAMVAQLVSTNQVVAEEVSNEMLYARIHRKDR